MNKIDGLPVSGYVSQTEDNIKLVNNNKILEEKILRILDELSQNNLIDKRWLSIGRTNIELGFMAINRSIFKPKRIDLE